ncbi:MAG TPA: hypothetical protein VNO35_22095 [Steroidobacteraceae bacterium]|nr:hypothetical protein [Steroidobacteraceae bacterium]
MGEFRISVSSIRRRFLEAFRLRSEHATSIDTEMRATIAARLVEEYGSAEGAADATWKLAFENEWYREGESAERYLLTSQPLPWLGMKRRSTSLSRGTACPSDTLLTTDSNGGGSRLTAWVRR